jgi:cell division septation protein DedD
MEETPSWKGHSFTLLVFGGIVVLCSIFFVLGMLVGRNQGQRIAETAAADAADRKNASQPLPEAQPLNFPEDTAGENSDLALAPKPEASTVPAPPTTPEPDPAPVQEPLKEPYLQIFATKDSKKANEELNKVRSKGFQAIISPSGDKEPFYRIWVGPYNSVAEAEVAKRDLQSHGYEKPLRR